MTIETDMDQFLVECDKASSAEEIVNRIASKGLISPREKAVIIEAILGRLSETDKANRPLAYEA